MKIKHLLAITGLLALTAQGFTQSIFEPNYALKSPKTLNIANVEFSATATVLTLNIENKVDGGYFCIDRNTYLVTPSGEKLKLTELTGLPFCPDNFQFKRINEIKYFTMKFPPVKEGTKWLTILEECNSNCLSIIGLSLDAGLNAKLNLCFRDLEKGRRKDAIGRFESVRSELAGSGNPMLGSVYSNLITLYTEDGDRAKAEALRNELAKLDIPNKAMFLETVKR